MTLSIIGLGLFDFKDITIRGKELVDEAEYVYLEAYTAILMCEVEALEAFHNKKIIVADRDFVEAGCDDMLEQSKTKKVAFLVVGDPFCATTHSDLYLRAKEKGVDVQVVHNASIMSAVAATGLQLYKFGETISVCFFEDNWRPDSFYDKIKQNAASGLHTLCLLDIKVKERTLENLMKNRNIFEPPRYMSASLAARQMLEIEEKRGDKICLPTQKCFAVCRIGAPTQLIRAATLEELANMEDEELGKPLHSLVICAPMHEMEEEFYTLFGKKE